MILLCRIDLVPAREMTLRELLNDFDSFLPSGSLQELHCDSSCLP